MRIGIVGLGYVGLPLAVAFCEAGHEVTGVDVEARVVDALSRGESHIEDVPGHALAAVADRFEATTRYADLAQVDAVIVAVPTPLTQNREPDLQPLIAAGTSLAGVLQEGQLVVLESTTYPGTTRERLVPMLEESGLAADRDFFVAFSPERIDPGRTDHTLRTTPKVVGGVTPESLDRAVELYELVCDNVVPVSTPEAAELTKLLENVFRSVNIALVNELAILCDRMGVDIWEVVDAAATKPYGFMSFKPGPGMGGHCLPVDPVLPGMAGPRVRPAHRVHRAGRRGQPADALLLRGEDRPRPERPLEADQGLAHRVLGVSYKAGVGDLRESPGLKIIRLLRDHGGDVAYNDDFVPELIDFGLASEPLDEVARGRRLRGDRHRPPGARRGAHRRQRRPWSWTSAGSRAASRPPTSCVFDGFAASLGPRLRACCWGRAWSCRTDVELGRQRGGARRHRGGRRGAAARRLRGGQAARARRHSTRVAGAPPPAEIGAGRAGGRGRGGGGRRPAGRAQRGGRPGPRARAGRDRGRGDGGPRGGRGQRRAHRRPGADPDERLRDRAAP